MKIVRLQIMLPYLNDVYEVGHHIQFANQAGLQEMENRRREFLGVISKITALFGERGYVYEIIFESGNRMIIEDTPVQIDYMEEIE